MLQTVSQASPNPFTINCEIAVDPVDFAAYRAQIDDAGRTKTSEEFIQGVSATGGSTVVAAPGSKTAFHATPVVTYWNPGGTNIANTTLTTLAMKVRITDASGQLVDELTGNQSLVATFSEPTVADRMHMAGRILGRLLGNYLKQRLACPGVADTPPTAS
jgi:hypothetical protein